MVRLLVVEDHALVREGLVQTLRQLEAGVEVCDVADATSAIEMLDAGRGFDMMLLDLGLPGVDGMTCQNCQRHVENALNTLPDTLAEVNLSARNVTVWTKADADEEVIRKAIRDAGYLPLRTKEKV